MTNLFNDTTEFENLNEYKNEIAGKLIVAKKQQAKNKMEEDLVTALVEGCEMDVPQVMIDNDIDMKIEDFSRNIQSQGLSLDVYLQYMGQTVESMREAYRPMSEKQVKARLALEAVANAENFTVEEADLEAEVEKIAKAYGMEKDVLKSALRPEDTENITKDIKVQKAVQFIKDNAVEA